MELFFVRHGQTDWNKYGKFQGAMDIALNDTGREQARTLAAELQGEIFDAIYCSPLVRAVETAQIIKGDRTVEILTDDRLKERSFGKYEGTDYKGIDNYEAWWDEAEDGNFGDMETMKSLLSRVADFITEIYKKHPNDKILVVAHGGVSGAVRCFFEKTGADRNFRQNIIKNCTFVRYKL